MEDNHNKANTNAKGCLKYKRVVEFRERKLKRARVQGPASAGIGDVVLRPMLEDWNERRIIVTLKSEKNQV